MTDSICDMLGCDLREAKWWHRALRLVASSRPGAWAVSRVLARIDRLLLRMTGRGVALPELIAAIPVVTLITTGARTGQIRSTPLLGIPHGDELALIGTNFGQPGTPSWYFNLIANPTAELRYRGRSVGVTAREVEGAEWDAIWRRACAFYTGYAAYAQRIQDRPIHLVALARVWQSRVRRDQA